MVVDEKWYFRVHYWNWDGISSVRRRVLEDSERQQKAA
jgi:hypothetical protein